MILVNTDKVDGQEIEKTLGLVRGSSTRARFFLNDIVASLKNFIGGEVSEYTKLIADTREQALARMIEDAERKGADAIVAIRFTTSTIAQGTSEILAFGTAVKLK